MQNMRSTYFHSQQVPHSLNETGGNERIGKYQSRMPSLIRIFFLVVRSYLYVISQFRISVLKCLVVFFFCRPASRSRITSFSVWQSRLPDNTEGRGSTWTISSTIQDNEGWRRLTRLRMLPSLNEWTESKMVTSASTSVDWEGRGIADCQDVWIYLTVHLVF